MLKPAAGGTASTRVKPCATRLDHEPLEGSSAIFEGDGTRAYQMPNPDSAQISRDALTKSEDDAEEEIPWMRASFAG